MSDRATPLQHAPRSGMCVRMWMPIPDLHVHMGPEYCPTVESDETRMDTLPVHTDTKADNTGLCHIVSLCVCFVG